MNQMILGLKFTTQIWIVFLFGAKSCRPNLNRMRNDRWVVITEPPLKINSMTNARCSLVYTIVSTKNGTCTTSDRYSSLPPLYTDQNSRSTIIKSLRVFCQTLYIFLKKKINTFLFKNMAVLMPLFLIKL